MNNLIPTPIVDKNGVATTRNKRAAQPAQGSARAAKAGVVSSTPQRVGIEDLRKMIDENAQFHIHGKDSVTPDNCYTVTTKVLGFTSVYLFYGESEEDAQIIGRIEYNSKDPVAARTNAYAGTGIKGGYWMGMREGGQEELFQGMLERFLNEQS